MKRLLLLACMAAAFLAAFPLAGSAGAQLPHDGTDDDSATADDSGEDARSDDEGSDGRVGRRRRLR